MNAPVVSVIIPVYNRELLVREALDSVMGQTFRRFEVIVVDDGSTDCTAAVLAERAAGSSLPLRVRSLEHDGHPGAVRNRGAEWARGAYLAFLDADDLWLPHKLERQLVLHQGGTARDRGRRGGRALSVLSHTRERWLRDGREVSQRRMRHAREGWIFADALRKCTIGPSTVLMRRDVFEDLGGFREDLEIAEDYELWLRLTCRYPVSYLDEKLTVKRAGHGDQLSERHEYIEPFRIAALRDLVRGGYFGRWASREAAAAAGMELARKCRIHAQGCRKRGRALEAERFIAEARAYEEGRSR